MRVDKNSIIKKSINDLMYNLKSIIFFETLYKLIVWFVFVPMNLYILNTLFRKQGIQNITNKQIIKFGLSREGLLYMIIMVIFSFISVLIEVSVLIYIAKKSHERSQASIIEGVINSFKVFKKLISPYSMGIILLSTIIGPLAGISLFTALISGVAIPDYVKFQLSKHSYGEFTFILVVFLLIIILIRWILALPIMVIENNSLKKAFINSKSIYKKYIVNIFIQIIGWVFINYGLRIFLLGGCVGAGLFFISLTEGSLVLQEIITNSSLIVFFIGYVAISIISLPLFMAFLVELYYKYRFYQVKENTFSIQDFLETRRYYTLIKKNRDGLLVVVMVLFTVVMGSRGLATVFNKVVDKDVQITAHRGSSLKSPENSISAITEAIIEGADYVEIDVMTTLDDYVVLFHDNTLRRFNGSNKAIKNLTLKEVQEIDIGSKFSEAFQGETIPILEEVLILCKNQIKLNIELKPRKKDDKLAEIVANMITEAGLEDQAIISSQSYESLQQVKEINPLIEVGLIVTFGIGDFSKMDVDFISLQYEMVKEELIYTMHALGKEVHVWTINDKKKAENAIKLGVDNIITDNIGLLQRTKIGLQEKDDVNYITRFLDGITFLIKHVKI